MTTYTFATIHAPSGLDRLLLAASRRLQEVAFARMSTRDRLGQGARHLARHAADERRRAAQALGAVGIFPA